jgi:hypothetical protein
MGVNRPNRVEAALLEHLQGDPERALLDQLATVTATRTPRRGPLCAQDPGQSGLSLAFASEREQRGAALGRSLALIERRQQRVRPRTGRTAQMEPKQALTFAVGVGERFTESLLPFCDCLAARPALGAPSRGPFNEGGHAQILAEALPKRQVPAESEREW